MRIRNLDIIEMDIPDKNMIVDGIRELDLIVQNNYNKLSEKETAMEFNIGSKVGEVKKYFVVYNNPTRKMNPYYFILELNENGQHITSRTGIDTFQELADLDARRYFHKKIANGFDAIPDRQFLGLRQIVEVRELAREFDEQYEL